MGKAMVGRLLTSLLMVAVFFGVISTAAAHHGEGDGLGSPEPAEVRAFSSAADAAAFLESRTQTPLPRSLCIKNPAQEKCEGINEYLVAVSTDETADGVVLYPILPNLGLRSRALNHGTLALCGMKAYVPMRVLVGGTN